MRFVIIGLAVALFSMHLTVETADVLHVRDRVVSSTIDDAEVLLTSLDEHLRRTIHAAAPLLTLAGAEVERALRNRSFDRASLHDTFSRIHRGAPQFSAVSFVDRDGVISFTSATPDPDPIDVSSRDYFAIHRDDPSGELRIGEPTIGRLTQRMIVPLTRRVNAPNGEFAGVVIGTLDAAYFEKFYSQLRKRVTTLSVFSETATLLARIPAEGPGLGTSFARLPVFNTFRDSPRGWFPRPADAIGPDRHVVYRRVEGLPFVLVLTIVDDLLLESWWGEVRYSLIKTAWVALALLLFTVLLLRATYRQERLAAGLQGSQQEFRDFAEASSDWMWETDAQHRFVRFVGKVDRLEELQRSYIGRSRFEIVDPDQPPPDWRQHVADLEARRPFRDFVYRRVSFDGAVHYAKTSGKPVFAGDGTFLGYRGTASDVTAIMKAQEQAAASRWLLDTAIETLHEGFVLFDAQDRFVQCNGKFREFYGETADLLVPGTHYETILRRAVERGQFPEAKGREEKWIKSALAYHHIKASTRQRLLPGYRWVEVREVKLEDGGSVGIHIDITDAKRAEEQLRENEERLRSINTNMPGAVLEYALGDDNIIRHLYVSERIKEITGYSAQEVIEDPLAIVGIVGPEVYAETAERLREAARTLSPLEREYPFTRRDGARRWARSCSRPRRVPSGEVLWDVLLLDITEQKAAEAERRELENQLRHLQRVEAVGTLAGGMAHEINNKLVPIVTFSELMLMTTPEDSKDRKPLKMINEAAGRIRDLVSRILTMSRSETPGTAMIEIKPVADNAMALLRATLRPNVRLSLQASTAGRILGDASQIEQVLVNLCTNAAHAIGTKQGEVRIELDETEIADGVGAGAGGLARGSYARLRLSDDGCGMSPQTVQRIFEPFYTTKGVGEGTGLGLSIVHGIVSSHRGRISVESELGHGTAFTILLPLAAANDSGEPGPAAAASM